MNKSFLDCNPLVKNYLHDTFKKNQFVAKICLIGDSGFIGKWIVFVSELLNTLGSVSIQMTGVSRSHIPNLKESSSYQHILVKDFQNLQINDFTHIIWGASSTSREQNYSDSNALFDQLLEKILHQEFRGFLLNLSSGAVYKNAFSTYGALSEDSPIFDLHQQNVNEYINNKIYIEKQILHISSIMKLDFLNARLFSFCGPGMPKSEGYAMNDFFTKIISNQSITLNGNPGTIRSFMHPFDLTVKVIELMIKKPNIEYLNIGSDDAQTIQFFAEEISKFGKIKVGVGADANDVSLKNYFPATRRLKQVTNTEDFFSTSTMLIDTYKYYHSQIS